jgi:hypothetical protein
MHRFAITTNSPRQLCAGFVHGVYEIEFSIANFAKEPNCGLIVQPHPFNMTNRD